MLEEKHQNSESNFSKMQEQYENIIKNKSDRIRELEIENEFLK